MKPIAKTFAGIAAVAAAAAGIAVAAYPDKTIS
jgi:hypothetical protein